MRIQAASSTAAAAGERLVSITVRFAAGTSFRGCQRPYSRAAIAAVVLETRPGWAARAAARASRADRGRRHSAYRDGTAPSPAANAARSAARGSFSVRELAGLSVSPSNTTQSNATGHQYRPQHNRGTRLRVFGTRERARQRGRRCKENPGSSGVVAVIHARLTAHREAGLSARRTATLSAVILRQRPRAGHVLATARLSSPGVPRIQPRRLALRVREERGGFKAAVGSSRRDPDTRVPPGAPHRSAHRCGQAGAERSSDRVPPRQPLSPARAGRWNAGRPVPPAERRRHGLRVSCGMRRPAQRRPGAGAPRRGPGGGTPMRLNRKSAGQWAGGSIRRSASGAGLPGRAVGCAVGVGAAGCQAASWRVTFMPDRRSSSVMSWRLRRCGASRSCQSGPRSA